MSIELVDQVAPFLQGASDRLIGLDEDSGEIVLANASALKGGKPQETGRVALPDLIDRARRIVAGEPRAATDPKALMTLAFGLIGVAAQLGRLATMLDAASADAVSEAKTEGEI